MTNEFKPFLFLGQIYCEILAQLRGVRCVHYLGLHVHNNRAAPPCLPKEVQPLAVPSGWRSLHTVEHSFLYHKQQASGGDDHQKRQHRRQHGGASAARARVHRGPEVYNGAAASSCGPLHGGVLPARKHALSYPAPLFNTY